jgi:hypothetical protein
MHKILHIRFLTWIVGVLIIAGGVAGVAHLRFGSLPSGLAYLRGERLLINPATTHLGQVTRGESADLHFRFTNFTGRPVRILGSQSSCTCLAVTELPVTIPSGDSLDVTVGVDFSSKGDEYRQVLTFFTDCELEQRKSIAVSAQLVNP